jgi:hypothetical protein
LSKKIKRKPYSDDNYEAELKKFIISSLRRTSLWWAPRNQAMKNARIERGLYQCNICKKAVPKKEIRLDHVSPVVKLSGFTNWDSYIKRMFPKTEGFQVLCLDCNALKTQEENILRNLKKQVDKKNKVE